MLAPEADQVHDPPPVPVPLPPPAYISTNPACWPGEITEDARDY